MFANLLLSFGSPDPETGKLRLSDEWPFLQQIFDEYGLRNNFYEATTEGIARTRNREIVLQLQDVWFEEGMRLWERAYAQDLMTREEQDMERAAGTRHRATSWRMDIFSLLQVLRDLLNKRNVQSSEDWVRYVSHI